MRNAIRGSVIAVVLFAFMASAGGPAFAEGPVAAGALPGGATAVDTDAGNGQRWGRAGGRSMTFSIDTPANFSALSWGVVSGTNPSLAFDGAATAATSEILSYTAGQSDLNGGMARWTGSAQLQLFSGAVHTIPTRFTLTVVNAATSIPLPLSFVSGGVNPGASVLSSGPFTVNLLFEMQYIGALGGDNSWRPVLDLYDALPTIPGQLPSTNVGPVMTGVTTGFYFTGAGMTIEEHDAHIAGLLGPIANDVAFLKIDVPNRLQSLGSDASAIKNEVTHGIPSTLQQILSAVQGGSNQNLATRSDVDRAKNDLQSILLILFGLMPCPPEAGPVCSSAKFIKDLSTQASVDAVNGQVATVAAALSLVQTQLNGVASQSSVNTVKAGIDGAHTKLDTLQESLDLMSGTGLDVQVTRVDTKSKQLRWLVKTTRDGVLVNATLAQLVSVGTSNPTAVAQNVMHLATVVPIATGLHDVTVNIVKGVSDGSGYLFEAQLTGGSVTLKGSALVGAEKYDD